MEPGISFPRQGTFFAHRRLIQGLLRDDARAGRPKQRLSARALDRASSNAKSMSRFTR